jgi:hypothetical protein
VTLTERLSVPPTRAEPPYRALLMGSLQPGYYTSSDEDRRERILPAMKALIDGWETLGGRLIGSFDDDLFLAGPPASVQFSLYLLLEVDSLDLVAQMLHQIRGETRGVRLDRYLRFEARIGRPLFLASDSPHAQGDA